MYKTILLYLVSISCFAETIPFKIKTRTYVPASTKMGNSGPTASELIDAVAVKETESIVQIDSGKVVKAIEEVRAGVCKTVKNGHIRMWFAVTAKGGVIVAETSGEGGLEVQFNCP